MAQESLTATDTKVGKMADENAKDTAYVINHAISCGLTDTVTQPLIGAFVQSYIEKGKLPGWLGKFFESHEHHGHDEQEHHDHEEHNHSSTNFLGNAKHWLLGEAAGDFLAVPLTILVQRTMPALTSGLRKILEPVAGWYFHKGAKRDAKVWALQQGVNADGTEAKAKEEELYGNEIRRLPLAFVWNFFSISINLSTQKLSGSKASWGTLALGKTFGTIASNAMLLGGRGLHPAEFEKLDKFNSKHFIVPATQAVGSLFGIDKKISSQAAEHTQIENKNWTERSQNSQQPEVTR